MIYIYPQLLAAAYATAHRDFMAALEGNPVKSFYVYVERPGVVHLTALGASLVDSRPDVLMSDGIGIVSLEESIAVSNGFIEFRSAVSAAEASRKTLEALHLAERSKLEKEIEALKPKPVEDPMPWDLEELPLEQDLADVDLPSEKMNTLAGHADEALDRLRRKLAKKVDEFSGTPEDIPL